MGFLNSHHSLGMNPIPFQSVARPPPPPWFPILPSEPPNSTSFWENRNVSDRLRELQHTLNLAKAMYVVLVLHCENLFLLFYDCELFSLKFLSRISDIVELVGCYVV